MEIYEFNPKSRPRIKWLYSIGEEDDEKDE
jgi:hypothetical protein